MSRQPCERENSQLALKRGARRIGSGADSGGQVAEPLNVETDDTEDAREGVHSARRIWVAIPIAPAALRAAEAATDRRGALREQQMEIYEDILETMGNTPLVRLSRFFPPGQVVAKVESFNPGGSVKDRIGIEMIEAAERSGQLKPGGLIVEPTSGNTGLGLAMVAALRGYRLICTAADKIPVEKVALLEAFGVEVLTCPTNVEADDPRSYYKVAERIRDEQGAYLPYQYYNQANPEAHYKSTGPEIWRQTEGKITHWVAGMGTGGTISGTARYLKEQNPDVRVVGVDPVGSVYAYYAEHRKLPPEDEIHGYLIDGIGEDFMPDAVWWDYIDEVVTIDDRTAYRTALDLSRKEAIFSGSSGGAAVAGAVEVAKRDLSDREGLVVTLLPDSGERYLSKFNKEWLQERGLL